MQKSELPEEGKLTVTLVKITPEWEVVDSTGYMKCADYCSFGRGQKLLKVPGVALFPLPQDFEVKEEAYTLAELPKWSFTNFSLELEEGRYVSFRVKTHQRLIDSVVTSVDDTILFKSTLIDLLKVKKAQIAKLYDRKGHQFANDFVMDMVKRYHGLTEVPPMQTQQVIGDKLGNMRMV